MDQAMHAARLAALQDVLFGLLAEQMGVEDSPLLDGLNIQFRYMGGERTLDIQYMRSGLPLHGEGL